MFLIKKNIDCSHTDQNHNLCYYLPHTNKIMNVFVNNVVRRSIITEELNKSTTMRRLFPFFFFKFDD